MDLRKLVWSGALHLVADFRGRDYWGCQHYPLALAWNGMGPTNRHIQLHRSIPHFSVPRKTHQQSQQLSTSPAEALPKSDCWWIYSLRLIGSGSLHCQTYEVPDYLLDCWDHPITGANCLSPSSLSLIHCLNISFPASIGLLYLRLKPMGIYRFHLNRKFTIYVFDIPLFHYSCVFNTVEKQWLLYKSPRF